MKFIFAFKKGEKTLIKIDFDDGKETWATCSEAVYNFAKNNFKQNDEVEITYDKKDGQYNVTRIVKKGAGGASSSSPSETSTKTPTSVSEYSCDVCGKELKDDKYKKCYTCNKNNKESKVNENKESPLESVNIEKGEYIKREAIMKASCQAINTLTGQISDVGTLGDMVITLYDKLLAKINK